MSHQVRSSRRVVATLMSYSMHYILLLNIIYMLYLMYMYIYVVCYVIYMCIYMYIHNVYLYIYLYMCIYMLCIIYIRYICYHHMANLNELFGQPNIALLLNHFSCVRLCAILQMAAHQAPPSLGLSRQEYWSGLPFPSPVHAKSLQLCPTLCDPMDSSPPGSSIHRILQTRILELPFPSPTQYNNSI